MVTIFTLYDALVEEVRDLFDGEKQLVQAFRHMSNAATSPDLCEALELHLNETRTHEMRLRRVLALLGDRPTSRHCAGIAGIIEDGADAFEGLSAEAVTDACVIALVLQAVHCEIAAYGTAVAWADALGFLDVAALLRETLGEKQAATEHLRRLAEDGIYAAAASEGLGDPSADEDDVDEESLPASTRNPPKPAMRQSARG